MMQSGRSLGNSWDSAAGCICIRNMLQAAQPYDKVALVNPLWRILDEGSKKEADQNVGFLAAASGTPVKNDITTTIRSYTCSGSWAAPPFLETKIARLKLALEHCAEVYITRIHSLTSLDLGLRLNHLKPRKINNAPHVIVRAKSGESRVVYKDYQRQPLKCVGACKMPVKINNSDIPPRHVRHTKRVKLHYPKTPFPFLQLPLEVHIMIYKYLIPDTPSSKFCGSPQRHDGPCFPAILCLNRATRTAAVAEWYNSPVRYQTKIDYNGVQVLGHKFSNYEHLPLTFYSIKFLRLDIKFEWRPARQEDLRTKISQVVPAGGRLEGLEVYLEILHPRYAGLKGTPDELREALKRTLSPLQALTGLSEAFMQCCLFYHDSFTSSSEELQGVVEEFFPRFEVKNAPAL